ncbi:MAG: RHS repeat-associated core domain-containing protein [Tyzzerella sp.]|nr:RHS repeat-associated core domain-containing protein [Tyzzerella sp.]
MGTQAMNTYGFEYDKLGRLKNTLHYSAAATTPTAAYTERGITYDLNGNITTLKRYAASEATPEDDYQYIYTGNKLMQITGTENNADISNALYVYDQNGNMTSDGLKNLQISYNFLNLPSVVNQSSAEIATYSWFADGSKYSVLDNTNNGYYYIGSLIYASSSGKLQIESTNFAGGRINIVENTLTNTFSQDIQYHHKDHLGSVRAITDNSGSVIEQNAYYPFGGRHTFGNTYAQTTNRFKFNGKEEQTAGNLGLLDYGARMYDANIGRWFVQDPLAEENISFSSYNYVSNNPISRIDYKGLLDDWVENKNGVIYWDEYAYSPETTEEGYVYLGPIVVVFNGSTDETLGTKTDSKHLNGYLDGTDAETAEVIVYGPNGEQDI